MRIGSIDLTKHQAIANSSYEYYRTEGGEIIGGAQIIKISGSIIETDDNSATGQLVMSQLSDLIKLGQAIQCINVNIPGHYSGQAKIQNISTEQGSDPSWINSADFGIEIKAPLKSIPSNSFSIVADDCVVELTRSSSVELSEDSHGYVYTTGGTFSKTFGVSSLELKFKCDPICTPGFSIISVINKLIKKDIHSLFGEYIGWNKYAKSRSVQVSSDNSATITTQYIITPHQSSALVDLVFNHDKSYTNKIEKKIISGSVTGLTGTGAFTDKGFSGSCNESKIANAEGVFQQIKNYYSSISTWNGITLTLAEQISTNNLNLNICSDKSSNNAAICIKPSFSSVSRSRTEGVIDFSFEWSSDDNQNCADNNGVSTDVSVDITEPQPQFAEFVSPGFGTILQNLNTKSARKITIQYTTTFPEKLCGELPNCYSSFDESLVGRYMGSCGNPLLIKHTITRSTRSIVENRSYICCTG